MIINEPSQANKRHTRLLDDDSRPKSVVGKRPMNYSYVENGNFDDSIMNSIKVGLPGTVGLDNSLGAP